ncbi:hypothetical protein BKA65DRAFT_478049 [Rhexocercosporidium sp. MPI-PUGE-AT-0058]|nr:hypothetical protein BKA65DRAFT_478049 [Rhexocercosporidium sp. MPI-PUGE-AT-0058]
MALSIRLSCQSCFLACVAAMASMQLIQVQCTHKHESPSFRPSHRSKTTGLMIGKVGEIGDVRSRITVLSCTVTGTICTRCNLSRSIIYDVMWITFSGASELNVQEGWYGMGQEDADVAFVVSPSDTVSDDILKCVTGWDEMGRIRLTLGMDVITMKQMLEARPSRPAFDLLPSCPAQNRPQSDPGEFSSMITRTLASHHSTVLKPHRTAVVGGGGGGGCFHEVQRGERTNGHAARRRIEISVRIPKMVPEMNDSAKMLRCAEEQAKL